MQGSIWVLTSQVLTSGILPSFLFYLPTSKCAHFSSLENYSGKFCFFFCFFALLPDPVSRKIFFICIILLIKLIDFNLYNCNILIYFVRIEIRKYFVGFTQITHSSEIGGLCLMKWPSETPQNLPYIWNTKSNVFFFIFHFVLLYFFP